jgi:hypothetical protein
LLAAHALSHTYGYAVNLVDVAAGKLKRPGVLLQYGQMHTPMHMPALRVCMHQRRKHLHNQQQPYDGRVQESAGDI